MPKSKPTQVITHRIEMGEWERRNIGKPVATATSNASLLTSAGVVLVGGAGVATAYALWKLWDVFDTAKESWDLLTGDVEIGDKKIDGGFLGRVFPILRLF